MPKFELRIEVRQYTPDRKSDNPAATTCWTTILTAKDAEEAQAKAMAEVKSAEAEYEQNADTNTKWFVVNATLQPTFIWGMSITSTPQRASKP